MKITRRLFGNNFKFSATIYVKEAFIGFWRQLWQKQ